MGVQPFLLFAFRAAVGLAVYGLAQIGIDVEAGSGVVEGGVLLATVLLTTFVSPAIRRALFPEYGETLYTKGDKSDE